VPMNSWPKLAEAVVELAENPKLVRDLQENALGTARAWPTWEDQAEQILGTIESLTSFGRHSLVRQLAKNQFRTIVHVPQPVVVQQVDDELIQIKSSRSWRMIRLLQRVRLRLAPDGSRRWVYALGTGRIVYRTSRIVWHTGRRIKSVGRRTA